MSVSEFGSILLAIAGAVVAIAWFFWQRFQALEKRLRKIEQSQLEDKHQLELARAGEISDREHIDFVLNQINGLIQHRTERFQDGLKALEERLGREIREVKEYLAKSTDFQIRHREQGD